MFPAACKDYYGIRNFGLNYGCLFAAFGSAGLVMPWVNGLIEDRTGSSDLSFVIIIVSLAAAAVLAVVSRLLGRPGRRAAPARRRRRKDQLMAVVTISRGSFTGGVAVAEALAAELGHPCVSREVVRDAAQESGLDEDRLQATLEEPPRFWEKTPGKIPAHLNLIRTALLRRARDGDLVYHGYAGHLLLEGVPNVLRVRVISDDASRVARGHARQGSRRRSRPWSSCASSTCSWPSGRSSSTASRGRTRRCTMWCSTWRI